MKKNIDKLFREKMSKSKITAPTESWPIIEAKLKRKKNIRFGYMFSLLGAISLVSFMLFSTHTENTLSKPLHKNTSLKKDVKSKDNEVNEININHDNLPLSEPQEDSKKLYATIATKKDSKNNASKFLYNNTTSEKTPFFEEKVKDTIIEKQVRKIDSLVNNLDSLVDLVKKDFKIKRKKLLKKKDSSEVENFKKNKIIAPMETLKNIESFNKKFELFLSKKILLNLGFQKMSEGKVFSLSKNIEVEDVNYKLVNS